MTPWMKSAFKRLWLGAACALGSAVLAHVLLAGWVLRDQGAGSRFAPVPFKLSARLALEGVAPPAWIYRAWLHGAQGRAPSEGAAGSRPAPDGASEAWLGKAAGMATWLIALACVERWGAVCEGVRVGLVRMGMTSRPPAQRSSWAMRAARQGLAAGACAVAMLALALVNPLYDPEPTRVAPAAFDLGLAWGPGARWLAERGLLP